MHRPPAAGAATRIRPLAFWTLLTVAVGVGIGWFGESAIAASRPGEMIAPWVGGACLLAWAWSVTRQELASWNICAILAFWMIIAGYILPAALRETVGQLDVTGWTGLIRIALSLVAWPVALLILYVGYQAFRPYSLRILIGGMVIWVVPIPVGRILASGLGGGLAHLIVAVVVALVVIACGLPLTARLPDPATDPPASPAVEDAYGRVD